MLLIFIIGAILRLTAILTTSSGADIQNFGTTAAIVNAGSNVYVEQFYYNYSPIPAHIVGALSSIPLPFVFSFRIFIALGDLLNAVLAMMLMKGNKWIFALVWCNPALILWGAWDAVLDNWTIAPLLVALLLYQYWRSAQQASSQSTIPYSSGGLSL